MADFLKNKKIEIYFKKFIFKSNWIDINILQSLYIFLILYLFYNVDLLDIYENIILYISKLRFINNINILTYNKSIK